MRYLLAAIVIIFLFAASGCGNDDTGSVTPGFDRKGMLEDLADKVIMPSYDSLNQAVLTLDGAINTFIASPDLTTLESTRKAFTDAYHHWQRVAFYEFGPAFDVLLMTSVNSFPADRINIDNNISSGTYDFNTTAGQDEKGFPAIDYLLFGADTPEGVVTLFTTDQNAQNRSAYLQAVSEDMITRISEVVSSWKTYRETFISQDGTDVGSSVGVLVNEVNKFLERETRDKKIGIPLGKRSQGIPIPNAVEAGHSDMSISLAVSNLQAISDFFIGKGPNGDGMGLYEYLKALNAQYNGRLLADVVKEQFGSALNKVENIPSPYDATVQNNPTPADEAYQELQKLVILMKADVPSALAVLITYQDNDGD